jgi:hypothetical protein
MNMEIGEGLETLNADVMRVRETDLSETPAGKPYARWIRQSPDTELWKLEATLSCHLTASVELFQPCHF